MSSVEDFRKQLRKTALLMENCDQAAATVPRLPRAVPSWQPMLELSLS